MSNTERQRQFRERNPGYYQRLHAKRRAAIKAGLAALRVREQEQAMAVRREPLMLPAPAVTIEIPGMNTVPATPVVHAMATVSAI